MASRRPSREERALWRAATRDVEPLSAITRPPESEMSPLPSAASLPADQASPSLPAMAKSALPVALPPAAGLDRRSTLRLKRGQLPLEARLDLHGMTQQEAHGALLRFVAGAHDSGMRAVLVITGKGARGGEGVLKRAVPLWLEEPSVRSRILAIATAQPKDGGSGALYVLLRRRR